MRRFLFALVAGRSPTVGQLSAVNGRDDSGDGAAIKPHAANTFTADGVSGGQELEPAVGPMEAAGASVGGVGVGILHLAPAAIANVSEHQVCSTQSFQLD